MKRLGAITLIALLPGFSMAQEYPPLGRLFLTPQERTHLDRQRVTNPKSLADTHQGEQSLTLNGEVRRSAGRGAHWVNGQAQWGADQPRPPVPVGDTYQRATGARQSLLQGGKIVIHTDQRP